MKSFKEKIKNVIELLLHDLPRYLIDNVFGYTSLLICIVSLIDSIKNTRPSLVLMELGILFFVIHCLIDETLNISLSSIIFDRKRKRKTD